MSPEGARKHLTVIAVIFLSVISFTACVSPKKVSYFNYVPDEQQLSPMGVQLNQYTDPQIQTNDLLQISVQTLDPQVTTMMGAQQAATYNTQGTQGGAMVQGYLVDRNGEIELPLVGRIKVAGMTTTQAKEAIRQKAAVYYKDPVVNIRFANFTVTVLGEVNQPGQYTVPSEKVSVYDAIGMAGDLNIGGKRDEILLMREDSGEKKFVRLNLNSKELFQSPYFYLRQHDLLYVPPTKNRVAAADVTTTRFLPFLTVGVSLITLIITATRF